MDARDVDTIPVDGVCTGCGDVSVHRLSPERLKVKHATVDLADLNTVHLNSYKRECTYCGPEWHNSKRVLTGLLRSELSRLEELAA